MGKCTRAMTYCVDNGIRALGPIFIIIALTLIFGVVYVLLYEILPYYTMLSSPLGLLQLSISAFILFNILFNYSMTILVHPGSTPTLTPEETLQVENALKSEPTVRRGEGFSRVCKFCKKPKPPRTHHCHICKCCVLRMDHHCPWVSNCVGFNNHKYFVLFLLYLCLGCFYVAVLSFFPFYSFTDYTTPSKYTGSKTAVLFVFVMSLSVMLAVGMLLAWHIYLVASAQTTIEFYYNRNKARIARSRGEIYHNEYDLGFLKNWTIFFGESKFWFLPSQKPPPGDGMVFLTRNEHIKKLGVNHHFV